MRRRLGLFLLLLSLFCQSAVLAGGRWMPDAAEDLVHTVLHWGDKAHHHHEDGTYSADNSSDSIAHVQLDGALQVQALLRDGPLAMMPIHRMTPAGPPHFHIPAPPPDGLRRPPKTTA